MDVILVPGFWLTASSWDAITPAIDAAGHRARPITLPGLETADADRSGITLADHIEAVAFAIDGSTEPVAIVAHSGGGPIGYAAAALRPGRVDRFVFVDTFPAPTGRAINDELPEQNGEIALPPREFWPENDVAGFTDETWASFEAAAVPEPAGVATSAFELASESPRGIPTTVIATSYPEAELMKFIADGDPAMNELVALEHVHYVALDTGHWPQLTRPADLATIIVTALA